MFGNFPPKATLTEVGVRDGFQFEAKIVPTDVKLDIIRGLIDAGITSIQVISFVNPEIVFPDGGCRPFGQVASGTNWGGPQRAGIESQMHEAGRRLRNELHRDIRFLQDAIVFRQTASRQDASVGGLK